MEVVDRIVDSGLVAVMRTESAGQAIEMAEACMAGGVIAVEITFTVPGAAAVIDELARRYPAPQLLVGAGTVLDAATARCAIEAGALYVVSPHFDAGVVRVCREKGVAAMPGAMTVREIIEAMNAGADVVKLFPGEVLGPRFMRAVRGPLPQARLMPSGGVTLENAADWIKSGAVAVSAGSVLTGGAARGDPAATARVAKAMLEVIRKARST
jgi:2-dehydro-3-deoxyphosphogluconate aldolase / (4S)-4-hydroxy-2-oxoglutarate aldolase